jgi:uncharacterized membrane protein required for colicin V production
MSIYDGVMLLIVLFAVFQGWMRGMAWQLAPIASLVLGYLFGVPLSAATAPWFGEPPLNHVFSLIVMYMLVSLGVYLIARSLRDSIEKMKLVEFDRHLGALLGGVKGVLFTVVLTIALLSVSPTAASFITKSESHTIASRIINVTCPLLPEDIHKVIDPYLSPLHDHADDEPLPFADGRDLFQDDDFATDDREPAPRRPSRNRPIFEDDEPSGTISSRPARRPIPDLSDDFEDAPAREFPVDNAEDTPADSDVEFGADPNKAFAEEPRPRVR